MSESLSIAEYRDAWSEAQLQQAVINLAHANGWRVAHFRSVRVKHRDGRVSYQTPVQADGEGFPDLVAAKAGHLPVFIELKDRKGSLSPAQRAWLAALGESGHLCRPADWDLMERLLATNEGDS